MKFIPHQEDSSTRYSPLNNNGDSKMKKTKLLTVAGSLVLASSLLAPTMVNAQIFSSAATCEAANLNQALQGIGWNQRGVTNNATTSFFVVCPMELDLSAPAPTNAVVFASFPGSGVIECTARSQNTFSGVFTTVSFTVGSGQNTGVAETGANVGVLTINGYNNTIVCALDPGEGVTSIYYV